MREGGPSTEDLLQQLFTASRRPLDARRQQQFLAYLRELQRWNRTLNLTSIRNMEEAVERHYCESLFVAQVLDVEPVTIVDVGSGGGFPGLPLAVLRPDCLVTLVESHQRKAVFLKEASRNLPNIRVLSKRSEDVEESFDWAISRAVSYEGLTASLKILAPRAALLTGLEEPPGSLGFEWEVGVQLPWGSQRFLRVGSRVGCFT